jgi:uncharacterized membrane protein
VLAIVGGLFVAEAVSVIIQVAYFKATGKRVFLMAPIHHHFEKQGWAEPQIVIRFWIISLILALIGLATLKLRITTTSSFPRRRRQPRAMRCARGQRLERGAPPRARRGRRPCDGPW